MAVIVMPDWVVPNSVTPFLRDFGAVLTPFLGGPEQRINRLGTRFGVRITLPPAKTRTDALVIQSRLLRAREDRLRMEWMQPDFDTGAPGAARIASAIVSGTAIPFKDMTPGYQAKEGQFLSIVHASRRYLHIFAADGTVASDGILNANIWPMLRTDLASNDAVEIATPMIEGLVSPGEELSWQISVDRLASFSFTLSEGA